MRVWMKALTGVVCLLGLAAVGQAQIFGEGFRVLKAEYGADQNWTDVTDRVQGLVRGNGVEFRVDGQTLTDPIPGVKKTLRVRYVFRGRTRTDNFEDLAYVRLGEPGGGSYPSRMRPQVGGLRILRAEYGEGNRWRDVTALLAQQIQQNELRMDVTNETMGGDPAPAVVKSLRLEYEYQGRTQSVTVPEKGRLNLPDGIGSGSSTAVLEILEADYGAQGRRNNVADLLRRAVRGDQLNLRVNNGTMGGDPYPGPDKELYVRYRYQGREYENFSREGSTLVLPNRYDRPAGGNRRSNPQ